MLLFLDESNIPSRLSSIDKQNIGVDYASRELDKKIACVEFLHLGRHLPIANKLLHSVPLVSDLMASSISFLL